MTIYLITRNPVKIKAAKSVFDEFGIEVLNIGKEYPEIQADTSLEIARHTAITAAEDTNLPVIREDHSLFIHALGIPGPYTSFIEKKIPPENLHKILANYKDRTGHFEIAAVYAEPGGIIKEFVYQVPIYFKNQEIVKDPMGGWSGLLCLKYEKRAFTEYPEEERLGVWNKNYYEIAKFLSNQISCYF